MATTFTIKNIRKENDEIIVFYEFSNGEIQSFKFTSKDTVLKIISRGEKRSQNIDERDSELERLRNRVQEELIDIPLTRERIKELKQLLEVEEAKLI